MSGAGNRGSLNGKPRICSEQHDILYSKARSVQDQRHIKRPWFNLNPFLEKTDETANLENFIPEEGKYVRRLESLVLCEKFEAEQPLDTREMNIDGFFAYLYSVDWEAGCSLRVLEGQLLDELLVGLHRLEHNGQTVRHTTYAIANNDRIRAGCYKHANREAYGSIEENLMIEFAYFGHLTKQLPNEITHEDPFDYLVRSTPSMLNQETENAPKPKPTKQKGRPDRQRRRSLTLSDEFKRFKTMNLSLPTETMKEHLPVPKRRRSLISSLNAILFVNAMQNVTSKKQRAADDKVTQHHHKATASSHSNQLQSQHSQLHQQNYSGAEKPCVKPKKGQKTVTKVVEESSDDFSDEDFDDLPRDSSDSEACRDSDDHDTNYGDELYLSDKGAKKTSNPETAIDILRKKKLALQSRRQDKKDEKEWMEAWERTTGIPPMPKMNYDPDNVKLGNYEIIKMPDICPTFEEFAVHIRSDSFFDPRYRNKLRMRIKKLAQRYYNCKSEHDDLDEEDENSDGSKTNRKTGKTMKMVKNKKNNKSLTSDSSDDHLPPIKNRSSGQNLSALDLLKATPSQRRQYRRRKSMQVLAVTDSTPCKEHYYWESSTSGPSVTPKRSNERKQDSDDRSPGTKGVKGVKSDPKTIERANPSTKPISPALATTRNVTAKATTNEVPSEIAAVSKQRKLSESSASLKFPKIANDTDVDVISTESSSDESSTGEDTDSEIESAFDASKLNIKYSIERIKKRRKSKTPKKKPAFMEILSKYYRMHNILSVFSKPSASPSGIAKAGKKGKIVGGLSTVAKVLGRRGAALGPKPPIKKKMVIGKLRHYKFQDTKPPSTRLDLNTVSRGDFKAPNIKAFHEKLKEALADFVVRREIVVSSIQTFYNASTSVTFTKLACFDRVHTHPE